MRQRETRDHKDPTQDNALGSVDKEWRQMAKLALVIRAGRCNPTWAEEKAKTFTGIYKRLLDDPIDEVQREAGK